MPTSQQYFQHITAQIALARLLIRVRLENIQTLEALFEDRLPHPQRAIIHPSTSQKRFR
jgi:hypothetical protein